MFLVCHVLTTPSDKHGLDIIKQNMINCGVKSQISTTSFELQIGLGHYISAIDVNPRVWDHLEKVEKMTGLEMGLVGLPL